MELNEAITFFGLLAPRKVRVAFHLEMKLSYQKNSVLRDVGLMDDIYRLDLLDYSLALRIHRAESQSLCLSLYFA
jgi:hypothetical protein